MGKYINCYKCILELIDYNYIGQMSKLFHKDNLYIISIYQNNTIYAHTDNDKPYNLSESQLKTHFTKI